MSGSADEPAWGEAEAATAEQARAWSAWRSAAAQSEIDTAIRELYRSLDADIAARGPTCWQSGNCCNFGVYGHRLYVTALEVAWFLGRAPERQAETGDTSGPQDRSIALPLADSKADEVCPFQIDRACSMHAIRPLGCRVFFCQAGTEAWQHAVYEQYLEALRALHDRYGIAYRYADWLALLDEAARADREKS
ncbi:MAG: hypothetical protein AAGE65_14870 [Planctomycetota bacterium]